MNCYPVSLAPIVCALILWAPCPGSAQEVIYTIDFSTQPSGDAIPWLKANGYEFKLGFENLSPTFRDGALHLKTDVPEAGLAGIIFEEGKELSRVKSVRIEWGVETFPEGADWEKGIKRLPIALMISFGRERLPSGFWFSPAPYFISPFIGKNETEGKAYTGRFWTEGGRYLCTKMEKEGAPIVTVVALEQQFKTLFAKSEVPSISAIGMQMNSKGTAGKAAAWIKKIQFLGD